LLISFTYSQNGFCHNSDTQYFSYEQNNQNITLNEISSLEVLFQNDTFPSLHESASGGLIQKMLETLKPFDFKNASFTKIGG
jgi:hypothetical protein